MDKQRADQIITEYFQKIYGFAIKKCYSYEEAEELCAEILKEVYTSLRRAGEIINVEGYIWRISEHTYAKYVSSRKKQEGISIDGMEIPVFDEYALEDSDDELRRMRMEVAFLTEKRRRIVYCFYYEDKSISAIAREMALPEGTVKWHLNKARKELKEGFSMDRKIGKLGLTPITAASIDHSGAPGANGGPKFYLEDKINLNIVYSVYHMPRTIEEIAEEMGLTPVYLEDKINFLESNGFLVRTTGNRYTTFVAFSPEEYSLELREKEYLEQMRIARILAKEYVPLVRKAVRDMDAVYIPGGNRELFEAAAVFYGISNKCGIPIHKDLSKYQIKTTAGGSFIAMIELNKKQSDPDYVPTVEIPSCWACGEMTRISKKYPSVYAWATDTKYCSREGTWENNLVSDYEYLYEFVRGEICDNAANKEKLNRLRERKFLTEENTVNIMMAKGAAKDFFARIPELDTSLKDRFAEIALECVMNEAGNYPPQMQDLIVTGGVRNFTGTFAAVMTMDILYKDGTFRPLTENEKVTSNLIMFSDVLPTA